ncbi:MAG: metallophosphoesterase [Coprobacillus sp.]
MITPKHLKKNIKGDYRLIVISDIHGHLDRLKVLLKKVEYNEKDYLVILGDFVEKGDQVIETIHYIQQLDKNRRTFVLAGNCEWALQCLLQVPELAGEIPKYLKRVTTNGCIRQRYRELHLDDGKETLLGKQKKIADSLKHELDYISHLPVTLKFNQFLFVHAGIEKRKDYQNSSLSSLLEMQHFYDEGHILDETVIVGHLPTSNYNQRYIHNDIIIDEEKKIICIDGGIGVKPVSQLNALIIESYKGKITYKKEFVQPLPIYTIIEDISSNQMSSHKISYPYFQVEILEKGKQFSLCFQKDTNQKLDIKNEFLYKKNNLVYCLDDYTDYLISAKKGEQVKLIGIYDEYAYIIYKQQVGWIKLKYLCINY